MTTSAEIASTQSDGRDGGEPYGKGGYEHASQGRYDNPEQSVTEDIQYSCGLPDKTQHEGKGGVQSWITRKLGSHNADPKHDDKTLDESRKTHTVQIAGEGSEVRGVALGSTTDSGEAVHSVSDGPARPFTIPPLGRGEGFDDAKNDIYDSQRP